MAQAVTYRLRTAKSWVQSQDNHVELVLDKLTLEVNVSTGMKTITTALTVNKELNN